MTAVSPARDRRPATRLPAPAAPVELARPELRPPRRLLGPGWPLAALIVLFPLWWAMGLMELIFPLLAIPMARELMRRRPIKLPPGFLFWALFLVWVLLGAFLLGVTPAGTLPGTAGGRLIGYSVKLVEFTSMTVVLLYIGNLRESELPRLRTIRMLGIFFLVAVAGGWLGTLFPYFQFSSPLELLLPGGMRSNLYVQSLVHPAAAQVQDVLGYDAPRPKAPFDYTNSWGNNVVVLGIWFLVGWMVHGGTVRRIAAGVLVCLAAVPVIYSLNRGVWMGIGVAVAYVAIRMALRGKPIVLFGAAGTGRAGDRRGAAVPAQPGDREPAGKPAQQRHPGQPQRAGGAGRAHLAGARLRQHPDRAGQPAVDRGRPHVVLPALRQRGDRQHRAALAVADLVRVHRDRALLRLLRLRAVALPAGRDGHRHRRLGGHRAHALLLALLQRAGLAARADHDLHRPALAERAGRSRWPGTRSCGR